MTADRLESADLMSRTAWLLVVLGLAALFGWLGWALWVSDPLGELARGSPFAQTVLIAGVVVSALLGGVLMWIAFRSSRRGFDDRATWYGDDDPR